MHTRHEEMAKVGKYLEKQLAQPGIVTGVVLTALKEHKLRADIFVRPLGLVQAFWKAVPDPAPEATWPQARLTVKQLLHLEDYRLMPTDDSEERLAVQIVPDQTLFVGNVSRAIFKGDELNKDMLHKISDEFAVAPASVVRLAKSVDAPHYLIQIAVLEFLNKINPPQGPGIRSRRFMCQ